MKFDLTTEELGIIFSGLWKLDPLISQELRWELVKQRKAQRTPVAPVVADSSCDCAMDGYETVLQEFFECYPEGACFFRTPGEAPIDTFWRLRKAWRAQ
jgi:hypothetical protein